MHNYCVSLMECIRRNGRELAFFPIFFDIFDTNETKIVLTSIINKRPKK